MDYGACMVPSKTPREFVNANSYVSIGANKSRRPIAPAQLGVLSQSKWIPLHLVAGGLVLEVELDDVDTAFNEIGVTR